MPEAHAEEGEAAVVRPDQDPGGGLRAPRPRQAGAGAENGHLQAEREGEVRAETVAADLGSGVSRTLFCLGIISASATPQVQPRAPQFARLGLWCGCPESLLWT